MERKLRTLGSLWAKSFSVDLDEVQRTSGDLARRLVIRHPSAVVIIPVLDSGEILAVHQYRYAMQRETLELPAGKLDPGEDPETTARRELIEETGYQASSWKKLLSFAPSLGYSTEIIHVFLARDLKPAGTTPNEDEIVRVRSFTPADLKAMVMEGQLIDGTTMVALAAYEWLG
jgi:ADP-ribose pyrophosphatase